MKQTLRERAELEAINYCISAVENCMRELEIELRKTSVGAKENRNAMAILSGTIARLYNKRTNNETAKIDRPLMTSSSGWMDELTLF